MSARLMLGGIDLRRIDADLCAIFDLYEDVDCLLEHAATHDRPDFPRAFAPDTDLLADHYLPLVV